jgi:deoxyribonuclease IV
MRIGAHVDSETPLTTADQLGADCVQIFLGDPKRWTAPQPRQDAAAIRAHRVDLYIHAPYLINIATTNNRVRIPSRNLLLAQAAAAADLGAIGLVVHGGHLPEGEDLATGFANWRKAFALAQEAGGYQVPILIENTAGGTRACARQFDNIARLWDAIGEYRVGFCLDTCHAHCGGEALPGIVDRVMAITGRIDLIHANNARDEFNSGRDRHANLTSGTIDPDVLVEVIDAAQAPVILETPGGIASQAADLAYLRERLDPHGQNPNENRAQSSIPTS